MRLSTEKEQDYIDMLLEDEITLSDIPFDEITPKIALSSVEVDIDSESYNIIKEKGFLTEEFYSEAIKRNVYFFRYIKNPTEKMKKEVVMNCGVMIEYIENPTEELQLLAVKRDGDAIQYIKNPTEEMKLEAVKENGYAIQYIKNPTNKMKLLAVKENGFAIQFINDPTEEMKWEAIKRKTYAMKHIQDLTEEMELFLVSINSQYAKPYSLPMIKNPTKEMTMMYECKHMSYRKARYLTHKEELKQEENLYKLNEVLFLK